MAITITKSNKTRAAIVYLYCPAIGTSSASLLQKSDGNKESQFCYFSSLYLNMAMFDVYFRRESRDVKIEKNTMCGLN